MFNSRVQLSEEGFDAFYTDLCHLSKSCDYGTLTPDMIKDRIVCGIRNKSLQQKLLRDPKLTLDTLVDTCRAWEATAVQAATLHPKDTSVNQISRSNHRGRGRGRNRPMDRNRTPQPQRQDSRSDQASRGHCGYCGYENHNRDKCPARNAKCTNCQIKGHFAKVCRRNKSKPKLQSVEDYEDNYDGDELFMGGLEFCDVHSIKAWEVNIAMEGTMLPYRVDTGADVTVLSKSNYDKNFSHIILQPVKRNLRGPDLKPLKTLGYFPATVKFGDTAIKEDVYIMPQSASLLSRCASEKLGIVQFTVGEIKDDIQSQYPSLFNGLGKLETEYDIKLNDAIPPYSVSTPRRIPLPLMSKVKEELERLQELDVITPVEEPTDWCAPIVVVPKSGGRVRLCVDLKRLNNAVRRERHMMPSVDHTIGQMGDAKVFTKLDANSGFHQIPLSKESQKLTTFITPFGRFAYKRLPFGISSGPEFFQREVSKILSGLNVVCLMDDIVVYGRNEQEHNSRLRETLDKLLKAGISLNKEKCQWNKDSVKFLGQRIGKDGVTADTDKVAAIKDMPAPQDIHELRRFLGMVNQLGKFAPRLAEMTEPLRALLSEKNEWIWGLAQRNAFHNIKETLTDAPVLALYNPQYETKVVADSSSYGLGAVLMQKHKEIWKPVAYASRALTPTETRYAQVEKEALASTWACERFQDYLVGLKFLVETDHKPLVSLFGCKDLDQIPPRIQRMAMRLMRFSFDIAHVPGKELYTADTLSRAPVNLTSQCKDDVLQQDVEAHVQLIMEGIPASDARLAEVLRQQAEDAVCQTLIKYIKNGWPEKWRLNSALLPYWQYRGELTAPDHLLMYGSRLLIPSSLRLDVLDKLHEGHQGITKCRRRARQSVWWPGLNKEVEDMVKNCRSCCINEMNHPEPLMTTPLPQRPWEKVATYLMQLNKANYIVVVDYYSRYIEIASLKDTLSRTIIMHMKSIFARHGIPQVVVSDNGPQYASEEFASFAKDYGFFHVTSSPTHPSSNGAAERAVKTVKDLLKSSTDPYAALLAYRNTPLENGYSPAELSMFRSLRTKVPVIPSELAVKIPSKDKINMKEENSRIKQTLVFNSRRAARPLPELKQGEEVWISNRQETGIVENQVNPRSYVIATPSGTVRRNRVHLNKLPSSPEVKPEQPQPVTVCAQGPSVSGSQAQATTRSGRVVKAPERLVESDVLNVYWK